VLIGSAFGATSPIRHPSEPLLVDLQLEPGARVAIANDVPERAVFVIEGAALLSGHACTTNQLAVLNAGELEVCASERSHLLLIGGAPLGARVLDWNFVATTKERIDRAREAWKRQEFPKIPTDHDDFVPYPELRK
jgi:redox-sensitive bicupin YhaK (pirin superfamily)